MCTFTVVKMNNDLELSSNIESFSYLNCLTVDFGSVSK